MQKVLHVLLFHNNLHTMYLKEKNSHMETVKVLKNFNELIYIWKQNIVNLFLFLKYLLPFNEVAALMLFIGHARHYLNLN